MTEKSDLARSRKSVMERSGLGKRKRFGIRRLVKKNSENNDSILKLCAKNPICCIAFGRHSYLKNKKTIHKIKCPRTYSRIVSKADRSALSSRSKSTREIILKDLLGNHGGVGSLSGGSTTDRIPPKPDPDPHPRMLIKSRFKGRY
jgi:hypothetical protein